MSSDLYRPAHIHMLAQQLRSTQMRLISEGVHAPKVADLAKEMNLLPKMIEEIILTDRAALHFGAPLLQGGDYTSLEEDLFTVDDVDRPEDYALNKIMMQDINNALDCLDERKKKIIKLRFGLEDGNVYTLKVIGDLLGFSYGRVQQLEKIALAQLREHHTERLHAYL